MPQAKLTSNIYHDLSASELLHALEHAGRAPSLDLIRVCMTRRGELTPELLELLARPLDENWADNDPRWYAQIHAGHLLIYYREPRAIPIIMHLLRDPQNENLVEWFAVKLASYGLGILPEAKRLLNDTHAPDYPRMVMTDLLAQVVAEFPTERARVLEILRGALPRLDANGALVIPPPRPEKPNIVWSAIATQLAVLGDLSSRAQIEALYRGKWIDEAFMGDQSEYLTRLLNPQPLQSHAFNIIETYENLQPTLRADSEWDAEKKSLLKQQLHDLNAPSSASDSVLISNEISLPHDTTDTQASVSAAADKFIASDSQIVKRAQPKIGRNDPCYCGSGRKYKHCHGKN